MWVALSAVQAGKPSGKHPGHVAQLVELLGAEAGEHPLLQLLLSVDVHGRSLLLPGRLALLRHVALPQLLQELILYTQSSHFHMSHCHTPHNGCRYAAPNFW